MYQADEKRYETMKYHRCGASGLMLPELSLGLWHNFGDTGVYENMKQMCFKAFDNGITHFDLANNYGPQPGSAEENFGKILREEFSAYRDELIVSTKAGYDMWPDPFCDDRRYLHNPGQGVSGSGQDWRSDTYGFPSFHKVPATYHSLPLC